MTLQTVMHVNPDARGAMTRRCFLGSVLAGTAGMLGWKDLITLRAAEMRERGLSCILLWMGGGPSQYESFDPKPGHKCMGPTKVIDSNVPGLQIGADWVKMSKMMDQLAVIRSMTGLEPDHPRATFHLHTGYLPVGGVKYPVFGANAAADGETVRGGPTSSCRASSPSATRTTRHARSAPASCRRTSRRCS